MTTRTWNTTTGDFGVAANWSPTSVPGTGDVALFGAGQGAVSGSDAVGTLQTSNGGNWFFNAQVTAQAFTLNGTDSLSTGARWTINGIPANGGYAVIGSGAGSVGTVLVTKGASIASTAAADTTAYGLYVGSGGSSGKGTLAIDGQGSVVDTGPNGASVGQTGNGQIVMTNGAAARFASSNSSLISALAVGRGGTGGVSLDTGSTVTADGFVSIGRGGNANLTVTGGSSFTGGATAASKGGAASFNIGDSTGATATTAYFGGSAILNVLKGSTVHALAGMNVGYDGSQGSVTVDGTGSLLKADGTVQIGGGLQRPGGTGVVVVSGGGTLRTGTPATGLAGMAIGTGMPGDQGTVTVIGTGSLLDTGGYRLSVGTSSSSNTQRTGATGTLSIMTGGKVTTGASSYPDTEAALAVGALGGGNGTITIDGPGSILVASGSAVIGGTDSGSGVTQGGSGTVRLTNGATLQTGAETIESGSTVTVDASSKLVAPSVSINGGTLDLGSLTTANAISFGSGGLLTVRGVTGANAIGNFSYGDAIDVKGATGVSAANGVITTATGSVSIGAAPAGTGYQIADDGAGGTTVSLNPQTIGVFRFFESTNGTHFYTTDPGEAKGLSDPSSASYRPDLIQEASGFGAYGAAPSDPNQVKVFRFFDAAHGTEFLTASKTEADGLINAGSSTYRADLKLETSGSFYEHSSQQAGDVAVYRFFDSVLGTHFYTASEGERSSIAAGRPDLIAEGVGFYAPTTTAPAPTQMM